MNTRVWGPVACGILHGCADALSANTGDVSMLMDGGRRRKQSPQNMSDIDTSAAIIREVTDFMLCMQRVLPCKYCRASLKDFLATLSPTLASHIRRGELDRWMYDLHNLVNDKLLRQQYVTAGVPHKHHDALIAAQTISLDVVRKRARVAGHRTFSLLDIEMLLCITAQNCVTPEARVDLRDFVVSFAALLCRTGLALHGVDTRLRAVAEDIRVCPDTDALLEAVHSVTTPGPCNLRVTKLRYDHARAATCSAGVCK